MASEAVGTGSIPVGTTSLQSPAPSIPRRTPAPSLAHVEAELDHIAVLDDAILFLAKK
jgi:hypothetical protein